MLFNKKHKSAEKVIFDENGFVKNPEHDSESDPFLYSLETLTPDQIAAPEIKKPKSVYDIVFSTARTALLIICMGVFAYSMYSIVRQLVEYRTAEDLYSSIDSDFMADDFTFDYDSASGGFPISPTSLKSSVTPAFTNEATSNASSQLNEAISGVEVSTYNTALEKMKSKLNALTIQNPDTYGWITVDGTQISYPVMQYDDNDYYLDHAYTGDYLPAGSIFTDFRNYDNILKNFNTIMYGHNMKNGLMFNGLTNYLDETFFFGDHYITVYTLDGIFTYQVFSIYKARYDEGYIRTSFANYDQFIEFAEGLEAKSDFHIAGLKFVEGDRILTLSTCTNGAWQDRYAVHAKLISVER